MDRQAIIHNRAMTDGAEQGAARRGRGAGDNPANRVAATETVAVDDGWGTAVMKEDEE